MSQTLGGMESEAIIWNMIRINKEIIYVVFKREHDGCGFMTHDGVMRIF